MKKVCPICHHFISPWEVNTGKTNEVEGTTAHNSCLTYHKSKTGKDWSLSEVLRTLGGG